MEIVYVLDKNGKPLIPTTRYCHVKKLLKSGKAVCINNNPFTIRLKYNIKDPKVQTLIFKLDTGRENIGIAVTNENTCYFRGNFKTNNKSVTKNMSERRQYRNERRRHRRIRKQRHSIRTGNQFKTGNNDTLRSKKKCLSKNINYPKMEEGINCKVCKGKESRFANRKRLDGWLTPSVRQLVQVHVGIVKLIASFLPISQVNIERVSFDFQKLENINIKAWEYSKGPLYGYKDYKDYIDDYQDCKCLMCNNKIERYHHIVPRHKDGSDSVKNIAGLCEKCHEKVHTNSKYEKELAKLKEGCGKQKISLLNSCMSVIIDEIAKLYQVKVTTGVETYHKRLELGLEKDHCNDAICIGLENTENFNLNLPKIYNIKRFKKKSNNIINARNRREYYYNEKLVAVGRHKGFEQKEDSLEEYMDDFAKTHTKLECDRHFHSLTVKPAKRTYTFHKNKIVPSFKCGDKIKYEKHNKVKGNTKTDTFICTDLDIKNNKIRHNVSKSKDMKYCKILNHNCIQFI